MKKLILAGALVLMFCGVSEASVLSDGIGKTWGYLTAPINCLTKLGVNLMAVGADFIQCVLSNINPKNIVP